MNGEATPTEASTVKHSALGDLFNAAKTKTKSVVSKIKPQQAPTQSQIMKANVQQAKALEKYNAAVNNQNIAADKI